MDTQTLLNPVTMFVLKDTLFAQPVQACSRDYGFDFDEEEVGREMLAPLLVDLALGATPEVGADEFDQDFLCFLS